MILRIFPAISSMTFIAIASYSYAAPANPLVCEDWVACQSKKASISAKMEKLRLENAQVDVSLFLLNSGLGEYLRPIETNLGKIVRVGDKGTAGICTGDKNSVCYMNQYQADKYCTGQGDYLPTAEQLARQLNPAGMSKVESGGFAKITPINEKPFFYDDRVYKQTSCDLTKSKTDLAERERCDEQQNWFWSSSSHLPTGFPHAHGLFFFYGRIACDDSRYVRNDVGAVRCVRAQ